MDKKDVNDLKELIMATQVICLSMTTLWGLANYYGDNKKNKIDYDLNIIYVVIFK